MGRIGHVNPLTYGWNWAKFRGSQRCLGLNHRDLAALDEVLAHVNGRTAVVQAGGNLGLFPKRLAQEFAAVYTFEPDAASFACLQANAPESNIVKFQAALGCDRCLVSMSGVRRDGKHHMAAHEGITHIDGAGIIPTLRIDDLGLPACDLIYLDVEGSEPSALAGAVETIARCRPVLVFENRREYEPWSGVSVWELRQQVLVQGYRYVCTVLSDEVFESAVAA